MWIQPFALGKHQPVLDLVRQLRPDETRCLFSGRRWLVPGRPRGEVAILAREPTAPHLARSDSGLALVLGIQKRLEARVDLATERTHQLANADELAFERAMMIAIPYKQFVPE